MTRLHKSIQALNLFITQGDHLYGPITTVRQAGKPVKKIPWSAFALGPTELELLETAATILEVSDSFT